MQNVGCNSWTHDKGVGQCAFYQYREAGDLTHNLFQGILRVSWPLMIILIALVSGAD